MKKNKSFYKYDQWEFDTFPKGFRLIMPLFLIIDGLFGLILYPFKMTSQFALNYNEYILDYSFEKIRQNQKPIKAE